MKNFIQKKDSPTSKAGTVWTPENGNTYFYNFNGGSTYTRLPMGVLQTNKEFFEAQPEKEEKQGNSQDFFFDMLRQALGGMADVTEQTINIETITEAEVNKLPPHIQTIVKRAMKRREQIKQQQAGDDPALTGKCDCSLCRLLNELVDAAHKHFMGSESKKELKAKFRDIMVKHSAELGFEIVS